MTLHCESEEALLLVVAERDEARAIARQLSNPLRYHAEHGCQMCQEHLADFDDLPWAKEPA